MGQIKRHQWTVNRFRPLLPGPLALQRVSRPWRCRRIHIWSFTPAHPHITKPNDRGIPLHSGALRKLYRRRLTENIICSKDQVAQTSRYLVHHSDGIGNPHILPEGKTYCKDRPVAVYGDNTSPELSRQQKKAPNPLEGLGYTINQCNTTPLPSQLTRKEANEADPNLRQVKRERQGEDKLTRYQ